MNSFDFARVKERLKARAGTKPADDLLAPAAIAMVLRDGVEGTEVLLIKRAEHHGDPWSGDLALPGGKKEKTDATLLDTAVRETEEEVGLRLSSASFLGRLDDVVGRTSGYRVAQFVFALEDPEAAPVTSPEVTANLWVALARLAGFDEVDAMPLVHDGRTIQPPYVRLGAYILWGMTYRMLLQLLQELRP
jgi:8-oxo-dGTP pyrophosphatase MutT (NUDIX family)